MTNLFSRRPHPARRARRVSTVLSLTAFATVVSSFSWNTHLAALAANANPLPTDVATGAPVVDSTAPTPIPTPTITVVKKVVGGQAVKSTKKSSTKSSTKKSTKKSTTTAKTTTTSTKTCTTKTTKSGKKKTTCR